MESIIIYPENEKQKSLLQSLLEEMNVRFDVGNKDDHTCFSKDEFYAKIDRSIKQSEAGTTTVLPKDKQKEFLGL